MTISDAIAAVGLTTIEDIFWGVASLALLAMFGLALVVGLWEDTVNFFKAVLLVPIEQRLLGLALIVLAWTPALLLRITQP
jgi:hypothetical protein